MIHPYSSRDYAAALAGDDRIVHLEELGLWARLRRIPGTSLIDAAGPYPCAPLRCPRTITRLRDALRRLGAVSFVTVIDALQEGQQRIAEVFPFAIPYKLHHVIDRSRGLIKFSRHHRREIRRAAQTCETRIIALGEHLDEWCAIYRHLLERHQLTGFHDVPRSYFEVLAGMPSFTTAGAFMKGRLESCAIWARHGNLAYSHLSASSDTGYSGSASYAVHALAVSTLGDCRLIDLGGAPDGASGSGLTAFKAGFATETRHNWICGLVVDEAQYERLCLRKGVDPTSTSYFPAYRAPAGTSLKRRHVVAG